MNLKSFAAAAALAAFSLGSTVASAQTAYTSSGQTAVALSSSFLSALTSLGVSAAAVPPATLSGTKATFPVIGGVANLTSVTAELEHNGGLSLSGGGVKVDLLNYNIEALGGSTLLTGIVTVNGALSGRLPLFNLQIGSVANPLNVFLEINNVTVTLNGQAAAALNSAFGVTAFTAGMSVGTASSISLLQTIVD